jgi:stage V sporulation protein R
MSAAWTIKDLEHWDARIREEVEAFGLDCYPQEFEICDHESMLSLMAYGGMPSHYPHWSFGKAYEQHKTLYDHGVAGLPYEMVINSNPAIAYLMRDNSLALVILTMAHVYGHNDFFKNNFTFSFLRADLAVEQFKAHARRVRDYMEDPSIGRGRVERILDSAHALAFQCERNPAIRKPGRAEQVERALKAARPEPDSHPSIHKRPVYEEPDLHKVPLEPDEDLLAFIRDHNPRLEEWQKDLLTIVRERTRYFRPQMETKIMNEGWAVYVHRHIMQRLDLPSELHLEYLVRHNQVIQPARGRINPYRLGLMLWEDIVRRQEEPAEEEREIVGEEPRPAREVMFEVRKADRDVSFLRRFLTENLARQMDLFEYKGDDDGDITVTRVSDHENWRQVKETLIRNTGLGTIPVIKVVDADYGGGRELLLQHDYDGRELDMSYAKPTMAHLQRLWGRRVHLHTIMSGVPAALVHDGERFLVESAAGPARRRRG